MHPFASFAIVPKLDEFSSQSLKVCREIKFPQDKEH